MKQNAILDIVGDYMQLKISVTKERGIELYITRDENNDRLYVMRERNLFFKKELQLYDAHKKFLAEVLVPFNKKKYTFKANDKIIDEMYLISKGIKTQYQLSQSKWILEVDITFTEYTIYDENHENIAEVTFNLPDRAWLINVNKTKDLTLMMLILLTIVSISQN